MSFNKERGGIFQSNVIKLVLRERSESVEVSALSAKIGTGKKGGKDSFEIKFCSELYQHY